MTVQGEVPALVENHFVEPLTIFAQMSDHGDSVKQKPKKVDLLDLDIFIIAALQERVQIKKDNKEHFPV